MENRKNKKISLLGVDPSPSLRAVLERIGEECGMDVDLCSTLSETRERLAANAYDLVVSAAELPDGDYLDVLASVRGESRMALTPVLLLIAGRSENMVREALDKGITEVFFKRDIDDLARYLEGFTAASPIKKSEIGYLRALVVEDDRTLGSYYRELLMQHGFSVDHVPSGLSLIHI